VAISENIIILTAADAVACSLADGIVASLDELLAELNASDAKIVRSGIIDKEIRKFSAKQRDVNGIMADIDYLNERAEELTAELKEVRQMVIERPTTTKTYFSDEMSSDEMSSNETSSKSARIRRQERQERGAFNKQRDRRKFSETITSSQLAVSQIELTEELIYVLGDMANAYQRLLVLARRWPGTLRARTTVNTLERQLNSAQLRREGLIERLDAMQFDQYNTGD